MKREEGRGASGSGEGVAVGGFPSNSAGNGGGMLGGVLPSTFKETTVPNITVPTTTDTTTDTTTATDNQVVPGGGQTPTTILPFRPPNSRPS